MSTRSQSRLRRWVAAIDQRRIHWIDRGTEASSLGFATRIRTFNRATLGMLVVLGTYLCVLAADRAWHAALMLSPAFAWFLVLPFVIRRHHFMTGRALTIVIVNATIFALTCLYGRGPGVHLLFFALVPFPLGIYEQPRERPWIILGLLVPIVCGIAFGLSARIGPETLIDSWLYPVMMATTFLLMLHPVWAFGREMLGYQELLLTVNQTIHAETARREQLEHQLENTRRVEALGELAAGVAHEINTPLQYVTDSVSFLDRSGQRLLSYASAVEHLLPELEERHRASLAELAKRIKLPRLRDEHMKAYAAAEEGLARVSKLVLAMKSLASQGTERTLADVNEVVSNAALVTRGTWSSVAELKLELAPDLPRASIVAAELGLSFVHLILNAADAIGEKHDSLPGTIWARTRHRAGRLEVEIEDTGCGIPDAIKSRVFEPFFTTKEVGRGSGQGLSLTHATVVRHGGELSFESRAGAGTLFRVSLPFASELTATPRPPASAGLESGSSP